MTPVAGPPVSEPFTILLVCKGNISRSPFAEILLRHLVECRLGSAPDNGVLVHSAGTHAVVGAAMHPLTRGQLRPWQLDRAASAGFTARQLTADIITSASLVLTASREQRAIAVEMCPSALRRTFCLREFTTLLPLAAAPTARQRTPARLRQLVAGTADVRGMAPVAPAAGDAVPDAVGRSRYAHILTTQLIARHLIVLTSALWPLTSRLPNRPGK